MTTTNLTRIERMTRQWANGQQPHLCACTKRGTRPALDNCPICRGEGLVTK